MGASLLTLTTTQCGKVHFEQGRNMIIYDHRSMETGYLVPNTLFSPFFVVAGSQRAVVCTMREPSFLATLSGLGLNGPRNCKCRRLDFACQAYEKSGLMCNYQQKSEYEGRALGSCSAVDSQEALANLKQCTRHKAAI